MIKGFGFKRKQEKKTTTEFPFYRQAVFWVPGMLDPSDKHHAETSEQVLALHDFSAPLCYSMSSSKRYPTMIPMMKPTRTV